MKEQPTHTEARLQQLCFTWHWNTLPHERRRLILIHNNPRNAIEGAKLVGMGLQEGSSDLLYLRQFVINNTIEMLRADAFGIIRPHFLECKLVNGVQSQAQKQFQRDVEALGWRYDLFRSLDDFQRLIAGG